MFLRTVATVKTAVSNGKNERQTDILRYTDRITDILDVPEGRCVSVRKNERHTDKDA